MVFIIASPCSIESQQSTMLFNIAESCLIGEKKVSPSFWLKFGWWRPFLYKTGSPTYRPLDEGGALYLDQSHENMHAPTRNLFVWVVSGYLQYLSTRVLCRNSTKENEHQKVFISISTFWRPKVHRPRDFNRPPIDANKQSWPDMTPTHQAWCLGYWGTCLLLLLDYHMHNFYGFQNHHYEHHYEHHLELNSG